MNSKSNLVYISDLHLDYTNWLEGISNYKLELDTLKSDLQSIVSSSKTSAEQDFAKKYLIQFNSQNRLINRIRHDIQVKQDITTQFASEHLVDDDHILIEDHFLLRDEYAQFGFLFNKLKKEFLLFVSTHS